jgi:hypothetical protein
MTPNEALDMPSALDRAEAELADTLVDPARLCTLSFEQAAAVVGELRALRRLQTFQDVHMVPLLAELERLRARDEAAAAVVRAWHRQRAFFLTHSSKPLRAALDALARAHADEDGGRDR